ncbi:MAG: phosphoadenylyl-sulfate reductase [Spirochaetaceae bacterium]|jgi:phosphoadenosine phosphosulfate reductase|nr:phosphoadenylyl-sulfate reductase [Spirochaetaceae bacterium]
MESGIEQIVEKISGNVALAFSHQAEDAAALHIALSCKALRGRFFAFTLDTRRFFPETETYHADCEAFFGIKITKYSASDADINALEMELDGIERIRDSVENRLHCCHVRKAMPLKAALAGKSAWITGLRAAQAASRAGLNILEWDGENKLVKINPLAAWTDDELDSYIKTNNIPLHPLYKKGFTSIGCAPCTRATAPGEDRRAGRWWWENGACVECGIHAREAALARKPAAKPETKTSGRLSIING